MWTDRIPFVYPQSLLLYFDQRKDAIVSLAKKRDIFCENNWGRLDTKLQGHVISVAVII